MASRSIANRTGREWISSLPACLLLLAVVLFSTSSDIHNQILKLGQNTWDGYYKLRVDPVPPTCDPSMDIEAEVRRLTEESKTQEDDLLGDLMDDVAVDPEAIRTSLENSVQACKQRYAEYDEVNGKITSGVRMFRSVELFFADVIAFGLTSQRFILALVVMICAATATLSRHHIAMRGITTQMDYKVSYFLQFIANVMLLGSSWFFRQQSHAGGTEVPLDREVLHQMWVVCFGLLSLVSLYCLFRVPKDLKPGGNIASALLAVPLYTTMCLISSTYFALQGHSAGIGIYLDKMMDLSDMFLNVALYVWVGMMLKETRLAGLVFGLFRPWRMPPELLAFVAVMVAAVPTAYTGASGIFVIAAGAVIYAELRSAGARRQLAIAATAMSGSLGVVLRPCLLVVVIAALNREVTTDQLFGWGVWVFVLTAGLFLLAVMTINRQSSFQLAPMDEAMEGMKKAFRLLVPYILVIAGVVLFYRLVLDVRMDEFSAPRVLPVLILAVLVYEHFALRAERKSGDIEHGGLEGSMRNATNNTTDEIGALLLLFGLSVSIGGVIERSGVMELFPETFASVWAAMTLMVVILIILGMIMDAFGAVILVSATFATIAYKSGIDPVHFWMTVLVAFELGYLSPPVALNHLLTRQVVGEQEYELAEAETGTFYQRYERYLLPLIVMSIALLLVAYVPLAVYTK